MVLHRALLWRVPRLLQGLDEELRRIEEEEFVSLLPSMRLAFANLDPRESDEVAERIGSHYGLAEGEMSAPVSYDLSAGEVEENLRLSLALEEALKADGLAEWGAGDEKKG